MILIISNNSRKMIPRNVDLFKLVTKIKYSKSMQSQRTDGEIKTSFYFTVNICKYVPKNGIKSSIHRPFITTKHRRVTKN